ncbi:MAG: hypothetical protein ACHQIG_05685 [Acidimicrobiia bacterium]
MQLHGIMFAMLDIPPELTEEYNRWYDLDHLPEHVSKADVAMARRYVAPRDLQGLGTLAGELVPSHAPYLTVYFHGIPDFDGDDATAGWLTKDRGIIKQGRFFRDGRPVFTGRWRADGAWARAGCHVSEEAIPYVAHRGVVAAIGRAAEPGGREAALRWWDDVHVPDLLAVDGVLAVLRFAPTRGIADDLVLHLVLLEDDPEAVMSRLDAARRYASAIGRFPPHGGVYEPLAFLPYRSIVPLEYDFEF